MAPERTKLTATWSRMSDIEFLKLLAIAAPIAGVLVALLAIPLAHWQDARDDRRRARRA